MDPASLLQIILAAAVLGRKDLAFTPPTELASLVTSLLDVKSDPKCFPLFISDGSSFQAILTKMTALHGVGIFNVIQPDNMTQPDFSNVITEARKLRKSSWCVMVVVVSDDPTFLTTFAEWSLKGRLLVWSTRLLVLTTLPREDLRDLLADHWTFCMTNTMIINVDQFTVRCGIFVHLPYTASGPQLVQVASWNPGMGLRILGSTKLFPEKYSNFHGSTINVTGLPYEPYWVASVEDDNTTRYSGIDYQQLVTVSQALNFRFRVLPSANWGEVTDQVQARTSFITTIVYVVLPNRLEKWDYTITFDYSPLSFTMAKPVIKPSILSFYYPLSGQVWGAVLASTVVVCITLVLITGSEMWRTRHGAISPGAVVLEAVGSLLGQGLYGRLSTSQSNHILVGCWLFFGVVVGTGYRGSLIASLTLPRLPPRPETVEELVKVVEKATIEAYGISYKRFFMASQSPVFSALGNLMDVGVHISEGLTNALSMKRAHLGSRQYLELTQAQSFTRLDGSSPVYVGRELIIPAASAWPIPHDAPYKPALDRMITAITEAGLYNQWRRDILQEAARASRITQRENLKNLQANDQLRSASESRSRSLTITHIQGPLLLLLFGLTLGSLAFGVEKLWARRHLTHLQTLSESAIPTAF